MFIENVLPLTVDFIVELQFKKLQHLHLLKLHLYIKGYDLRLPSFKFAGVEILYLRSIGYLIGESLIFKLFLNKLVHLTLCRPVILIVRIEDKFMRAKSTDGCR